MFRNRIRFEIAYIAATFQIWKKLKCAPVHPSPSSSLCVKITHSGISRNLYLQFAPGECVLFNDVVRHFEKFNFIVTFVEGK